MSREIFINVTSNEARVAVLESGILQEVYIERSSSKGIVGNVYLGKVVRVLPGMQAAFIDIGLDKAAFLHVSDIPGYDLSYLSSEEGSLDEEFTEVECITNILSEGKLILVQVVKDTIGNKGARLTTKISLAARYLVFMPDLDKVGVSNRLDDEEEKERLKEIVSRGDDKGFIIRTAAEGASEEQLSKDKEYLKKSWDEINNKISISKCGDLLHGELPLGLKAIRDLVTDQFEKVRIDSSSLYERAVKFSSAYVPEVLDKLELYEEERNLFDLYSIEDEIKKSLDRKVPLKSGGYIVIDQTEALTTIDVNTGSFVGHHNLEETIYKTNLEAAQALARQLKVRNLGGIIIIDFIDMENEEHWKHVLSSLEKELSRDYVKNKIHSVSPLGIVEVTRKRTRESLERILCESCPLCDGRGSIKTVETICNEIFREVLRSARAYSAQSYLILASQNVVDRMLEENTHNVAELEDSIGVSIKFRVEPQYQQEQFDVVLI